MQVKWIKICTDIFDDEKIILIENMPDAYAIITVWFKLLCLAGKQNNCGAFMLNDRIAYTDKMLAMIFRMKESTVTMALQTFEQFGMIEMVGDVITIPNWEKHQNEEKMAEIREYNRLAQKKSREKKKLLKNVNDNVNDISLTSQECQGTELDKELDLDIRNKNKKISFVDSLLSDISDDELKNLYLEYIAMRKAIKSPITTERALKMLINKVNTLEPNSIERQKKMLENAIVGNWKSVYPLKEEKTEKVDASYDIDAFRNESLFGELKYERKKK
jgi:predicted phage replisome organizer